MILTKYSLCAGMERNCWWRTIWFINMTRPGCEIGVRKGGCVLELHVGAAPSAAGQPRCCLAAAFDALSRDLVGVPVCVSLLRARAAILAACREPASYHRQLFIVLAASLH